MDLFLLVGSIILAILFYFNLVSTIKKIKKEEVTSLNSIFGGLSLGFIVYSIFILCGR